ncbi:hypothetical protein AMTR_s00069p00150990 [Amborella trichopoda]|uniref:DNA-directed RNA polymerase subunit n=1 Tax=Amborella trichopoda TaxID=13333 RepID=U5D188_AMBTC|nr:hypothetical protein AMTR_s00069p00150990 [Amborella trichopoda]
MPLRPFNDPGQPHLQYCLRHCRGFSNKLQGLTVLCLSAFALRSEDPYNVASLFILQYSIQYHAFPNGVRLVVLKLARYISDMETDELMEMMVPMGHLNAIKFEFMTREDIEKFSVLSISNTSGVTDPQLGLPTPDRKCSTCGASDNLNCDGHFGDIELPATIYNPYLVHALVQILNNICPGCKSIRQKKGKKLKMLDKGDCKYCAKKGFNEKQWYPSLKFKVVTRDFSGKKCLSIMMEVDPRLPAKFHGKALNELLPDDYWEFIPNGLNFLESSGKRILSPYQAYTLLESLDPGAFSKYAPRRQSLFLNSVPVTPNHHRVMESKNLFTDGPHIMPDNRTMALKKLISASNQLLFMGNLVTTRGNLVLDYFKESKFGGKKLWKAVANGGSSSSKWFKDTVLGKRTNYAFRMTVVGDPKIKLGEIGFPRDISENLMIPQHVNLFNLKMLTSCAYSILQQKTVFYVRRKGDLVPVKHPYDLEVGDVIYRNLRDGDLLMINRPPSVHQHSLIAFTVRVLNMKSVISINPLCCSPFFGDFDGDCLHGFVPQSIDNRVELQELMTLHHQLLNGQDGLPLVSLSHDSLTAAYLVTRNDEFLDQFQMQQLQMFCPSELPIPAICKSPLSRGPLWTGHQFFSMFLPKSLDYQYVSNGVLISEGELLTTSGESRWLQNSNEGIFFAIVKHVPLKALSYLHSAQEALCMDYPEDYYSNRIPTGFNEQSGRAFRDVYFDILRLIPEYGSKNNSLLAMTSAGSKGSIQKLVEQSMCLGLQISRNSLSFGTHELNQGHVSCTIVETSFLDGLNPFECLVHASSSRGNCFSDSADVPGTLTRKLMFFLRDLCLAYDGTVRSAYGNQVIQFSYGNSDGKVDVNCDKPQDLSPESAWCDAPVGGLPVGSLAGCAISEAAYSALDHPLGLSGTSPLLDLKHVDALHAIILDSYGSQRDVGEARTCSELDARSPIDWAVQGGTQI